MICFMQGSFFYLITRRQRVSLVLIIQIDTKIIYLIVVVDLNKLWTTVTTTTTHSHIIKSVNLWIWMIISLVSRHMPIFVMIRRTNIWWWIITTHHSQNNVCKIESSFSIEKIKWKPTHVLRYDDGFAKPHFMKVVAAGGHLLSQQFVIHLYNFIFNGTRSQ